MPRDKVTGNAASLAAAAASDAVAEGVLMGMGQRGPERRLPDYEESSR